MNQPIIPPIAVPGVTGPAVPPHANPNAAFAPPQLPPGATVHNPPALPPQQRFVKWGYYQVCPTCRYTQEFCGCQKPSPPPPTPGDGDGSDLNRRISQARSGR